MRKRTLVRTAFVATALMVEGAIALSRHGQSSVSVLARAPVGRTARGELALHGQSRPVDTRHSHRGTLNQ